MSIRHKAFKATLDRGYASEWNDDHVANFSEKLLQTWTFAGKVIPADFETNDNKTGTVTIGMNGNHSWVTLATGGDVAAWALMVLGSADTTNRLDLPVLNMAVKLETTEKMEFGFFDYDTAIFTANARGAYFRVLNNVLYAVTGTGAAETATNLGAPSTYGNYRIEWLSASVKFYVDDMVNPAATHTTNITADDVTVRFAVDNPNGAAQTMRVDAIGLQRLRKM